MKLCERGKATAKKVFKVYPSAYANGYAVQVCKGTKPDYLGVYRNDYSMTVRPKNTDLARWYKENWVNVCEGFAPCGRKHANMTNYPYCRPMRRLPGTTVKTVTDLTQAELKKMCTVKRKAPMKRATLKKLKIT